jgi:hypothetical protein
MGLDTCLKHTYNKNDTSSRWVDRTAAIKMEKDIQAGYVVKSKLRPICRVCRKHVTRVQLLLVPKDTRNVDYDSTLARFTRLVWNYSAPSPCSMNEYLRYHPTTRDQRPDFINYGSHLRAARLLLQTQDRAAAANEASYTGLGPTPWAQVFLAVMDQPSAYRQMSSSVEYQDYACALLMTLDDPTSPLTSTLSPSWVRDLRLNFGATLSGFHQYTNVLHVIAGACAIYARQNMCADAIVNTDDFLLMAEAGQFQAAKDILVAVNSSIGYSLVGKSATGFPDLSIASSRTLWCGAVYGAAQPGAPAYREIPVPYMLHTTRMVSGWIGATSASISDTEELIGTLIWLTQIAPSLRPSCQPILALRRSLAQLERGAGVVGLSKRHRSKKNSTEISIQMPPGTAQVLENMMMFLTRYVRHPITRLIRQEEIDARSMLFIFSDSQPGGESLPPAAGLFVAGFYTTIIFSQEQIKRATRDPDEGQGPENNCLELYVALIGIVVAWKLFPDDFHSIPRVTILDSSVAEGQLRKNRARHPESNRLLHIVNLVSAISGFQFSVARQPTARVLSADMIFADPLSRLDEKKFRDQVDDFQGGNFIHEIVIPAELIDLTDVDAILNATIDLPDTVSTTTFKSFWRSQQEFVAAPRCQGN